MAQFNSSVVSLIALVAITAPGHFGYAQTSSTGVQPEVLDSKSAHIAVSVVLPRKQIPAGQKPWVVLTVENLGGNVTSAFPETRVHVEEGAGEPPTTLYQRQITHTLRPGERELMMGGFQPSIGPALSEDGPKFSADMKYDLSLLYDLTKPGEYTVYIEALDLSAPETIHGAGLWVRSKTVPFEIQAPNQ
jgi:hypothetical protein